MRILREKRSTRYRASLRGVVPAVVTLVVFVLVGLGLATIVAPDGGTLSIGDRVAVRAGTMVLYVALTALAIGMAAKLDRRDYASFGLDIDREWARDFLAGTAITLAGVAISLGWDVARGIRDVDLAPAANGPGGPATFGLAVVAFAVFLLSGNVYEEVVYRGIALQNFAEGLVDRGVPPRAAVPLATTGGLVLFGLYHVPLRGNFIVAVDAAMVGTTFALAYLLTGNLGLSVGVHFGRVSTELITGWAFLGFELDPVVELTRTTLAANLEAKLVQIGTICLLLVAWAYLVEGEVGIAESVYERDDPQTE